MRTEFEFECHAATSTATASCTARHDAARDGPRRAAAALRRTGSENAAFTTVVLLGRVITRLGTVPAVTAQVVENMFASDVAFLQDFYRRINAEGHTRAAVTCPSCSHRFTIDLAGGRLGES